MKAYIASPFFNEVQVKEVETIEKEMERLGVEAFSPRLSKASVMYNEARNSNMDPNSPEMKRIKKYIFIDDVEWIDKVDLFMVNLNNYDSGTLWELGYRMSSDSFCPSRRIISFGSNTEMLPELMEKYNKLVSEYTRVFNAASDLEDTDSNLKKKSYSILVDLRKDPVIKYFEDEPRYHYSSDWDHNINSIWVLSESDGGPKYIGLSKMLLGYLFQHHMDVGPHIKYVDVPRKSNIMLTQSGTHVYEYYGTDYANEKFNKKFIEGLKPIEAGYDD